jgi:putative ABC transport system permease protein
MRSLVFQEGLLLSVFSIPFGLLIGFIASKLLFFLLGNNDRVQMVNGDLISKAKLFNFPILLIAALLSVLTVYLSLRKPMRMVGSLSPVDAIRYQEQHKKNNGMRKGKTDMNVLSLTTSGLSMNRRRTITTIFTLGLSSVLFVTVANVAGNMDAEYDARMQVEKGQFMIELDAPVNDETYPENNYHVIQAQNIFDAEFLEKVRSISGVTGVELRKKLPVRLENSNLENSNLESEEAYCTIAVLGTEDYQKLEGFLEQGEIDYDVAAEQNGVVFTWDFFLEDYGFKIGDDVVLSIFDGDNEVPFTGKLLASSSHGDGMFVMTEDTFDSLHLKADMTSTVFVFCEKGMEAEVQSSLESLVNGMEHVEFTAYANVLELSELGINTMKSALYVLLAVVGMIGFMNMANTLITSVMTRKRELGILQAIGMTTAQLNRMLQMEGLILTAGTLIVALTVGNICGYLAFSKCKEQSIIGIHQYHIPLLELGIMVGALLILQAVLSYAISKNLQKDTLIDRIRYEE